MNRCFGMTFALVLGVALVSNPAKAWDHGHDRDHDRDDRKEVRERDGDRHHWRGDRDRDRDGRGEPRGWSHGRKEGWKKNDCDLPPGLAKKNPDCGESRHHRDRDGDWDRDRDRDRDRVGTGPAPTDPMRPRTPIAHRPVRTLPTRTVTKRPTHKIRNPAEMIDPKTGKVVR